MNLALIGIGKMGREIAINLLKAGHAVTVYNRTAGRARELEPHGARLAGSPADAARDAEVVLSMVFDDAAVEAATFGPDGILAGMNHGAVHANLSTIGIPLAKRLEAEHEARGVSYVGAPVMGRPEAAREAKLVILTGGKRAAIATLMPVFQIIGRATFVAGPEAWHGNLFKVCANFMISSMLETFGEAQALVEKAGCSQGEFLGAMTEFWKSPVYANYGAMIAQGKYDPPGATLMLGVKDNGLLLDAAKTLAVPMPVGSVIRDQMLSAVAAGNRDLDWASLTDTAFRNAGLAPNRPGTERERG